MFNRQGGDYSSCYANLKEHLGNKTAKDLMKELNKSLDEDQAADRLPNPHLVAAYIDLVQEIDPQWVSPPPEQSAVERFIARHPEAVPKEKPEIVKENKTARSPGTTTRVRSRGLAKHFVTVAGILTALLLAFTFTAYGEKIRTIIFDIGDDIISSGPNTPAIMELAVPGENGYYTLEEALNDYGITGMDPKWMPDGSIIQTVDVSPTQSLLMIVGVYLCGDDAILVSVSRYETEKPDTESQKSEKTENTYESGGNIYTLAFNYEFAKAVWSDGMLSVTISGNLSEQELKRIIDSISER